MSELPEIGYQENTASFVKKDDKCIITVSFERDEKWDNEKRVQIVLDVFMKAAMPTINGIAELPDEEIEKLHSMMSNIHIMPEETKLIE